MAVLPVVIAFVFALGVLAVMLIIVPAVFFMPMPIRAACDVLPVDPFASKKTQHEGYARQRVILRTPAC